MMIWSVLTLLVSLIMLFFGAQWVVGGASTIARRFGLSDMIIGLTVVALGTSAPELVVNLMAAFNGSADIALGNVVGSNNFNLFIILGASMLFASIEVKPQVLKVDLPYNFLIPCALLLVATPINANVESINVIARSEGALMLMFFVIYYWYTFQRAKHETRKSEAVTESTQPLYRSVLWLITGLVLLFLGGQYTVESAVDIARVLGLSERVIALTIVAGGTSLPELVTSVVAARRGQSEMALGNVIGSNFFNVFFILGLTATIRPLEVSQSFTLDLWMMFLSFVMLFAFSRFHSKGRLDRREGIVLISTYLVYLVYMILGI